MTTFRHFIIIAAYGVFALAVALALPSIWPDIGRGFALLVGVVTFLVGGLIHESTTRLEGEQRMARRFQWIRQSHEDLLKELGVLREREQGRQNIGAAAMPQSGGFAIDAILDLRLQEKIEKSLAEFPRAVKLPPRPFSPSEEAPSAAATDNMAEAKSGEDENKLANGRREPSLGSAPAGKVSKRNQGPVVDDEEVLEALRQALKYDRVDLYQQPIVGLPQRKLRFFEVFSRIRDEKGTNFWPQQYIGLAERENLITAVDNLLLFRCIQCIRDTERKASNAAFFCNLSPATLGDTGFMSEFANYMHQNQALVPKLVFELKQEDLLGRYGIEDGLLERMRRLRFHFSMDRVTSFDLPLDLLAKNDVRFLKMEAALVLAMAREPDGLTIINEFQEDASRAGLDLIVEKIESEQDLLELLDLQIDFGQGYLFGEPKLYKPAA